MSVSYPFDPNGTIPGNKILNENIALPVAAFRNFHFIVPKAAPFHKEGVVVRLFPSGTVLTEGVDYWLTHKFTAATRSVGRPVYGSISFLNKNLAGVVSIDYQTIGGDWTQTSGKIVEILSNQANNPRITTWDQVADVPYAFPPTNHNWDLEDLKGADDIVEAIENLTEAVLQARENAWNAHINQVTGNPHNVTKTDVGLPLVQNYAPATQGQALDANNNTTYMTPLRCRQLFNALVDEINGGGGGPGGGSGDVLGPEIAVNGSVPTFDGITGKVINDLNQLRISVTGSSQRVIVGQQQTGLPTLLSLVDARPTGTVRYANIRVSPASLTADINLDIPNRSGTLMVESDMFLSPGYVAYRAPSAGSPGLPNGELQVSTTSGSNTLAQRTSSGSLQVGQALTLQDALPLGQATTTFLPITGHGLVPYSKVVQSVPVTPANDTILSVPGLVALLEDYVTQEDLGNYNPGGGGSALSIIYIDNVGDLPYSSDANRVVVVTDMTANGVIVAPALPANNDRLVVCTNNVVPGFALTVSFGGNVILNAQNNERRIATPYTFVEFQFSTSLAAWVAVRTGRYAPEEQPAYAPITFRGQFSLAGGSLPTLASYNVGEELEITNGGTIGGILYPTGSFIRRLPTGWSRVGGTDTTELEQTIDTLIAGFNNLTTALQA